MGGYHEEFDSQFERPSGSTKKQATIQALGLGAGVAYGGCLRDLSDLPEEQQGIATRRPISHPRRDLAISIPRAKSVLSRRIDACRVPIGQRDRTMGSRHQDDPGRISLSGFYPRDRH